MEGNLLWHWYTTLCTTLCWSPAIDAIKDEKYREKMRKIWYISLSFIVYCWVFLIFIHNYLFIPCAVFLFTRVFFLHPLSRLASAGCPGDFYIVLLIGWKWEEMSCGGLIHETQIADKYAAIWCNRQKLLGAWPFSF